MRGGQAQQGRQPRTDAQPSGAEPQADGPPPQGPSLQVTPSLSIPLAEVTLRASRSSGPGGQHANVTASRVEASFDVGASRALSHAQRRRLLARAGEQIVAIAQDERSQARNRRLALERLAARIAAGLAVPRRRRPTKPTAASRERRLQDKRRAAQRKAARRPPEDAS